MDIPASIRKRVRFLTVLPEAYHFCLGDHDTPQNLAAHARAQRDSFEAVASKKIWSVTHSDLFG
jgi:hypothetical protein